MTLCKKPKFRVCTSITNPKTKCQMTKECQNLNFQTPLLDFNHLDFFRHLDFEI